MLTLVVWSGAFNTENFRAGFEAVPYRYREAGLALGFGRLKTFLNVTLPIGGRIALPSSINGGGDGKAVARRLAAAGAAGLIVADLTPDEGAQFEAVARAAGLAVIYLVIVWLLSGVIRALEARLALPEAKRVRTRQQRLREAV